MFQFRTHPSLREFLVVTCGLGFWHLGSSSLSAQIYTPVEGQRMRVSAPRLFPDPFVGIVESVSETAFTIRLDTSAHLITVPYDVLRCLERRASYDPHAGPAVGASVATLGWITYMLIENARYDGTTGANLGLMWTPVAGFLGWQVGKALRIGSSWMPTPRIDNTPLWRCGYE